MIARALHSPSVYLPGIVLAALAIAMWSSGWFWVLLLVAAFAFAPWFAAARLLDDKAELTTRVERLTTALSAALAEHANCPAPVERFVEVARAADERRLRVVEGGPCPVADEAWLDETPLFHDGEGRWV